MEAWFTIFSYHVNRPIETTQGNSVNEFLRKQATVNDEFTFSIKISNMPGEKNQLLRDFIIPRMCKGVIYSGAGQSARINTSTCYYCLVRNEEMNLKSIEDTKDYYFSQEYVICFVMQNPEGADDVFDLFRQELDEYCKIISQLLFSSDRDGGSVAEDEGLRVLLDNWYINNIEYITRCVHLLSSKLESLIYYALEGRRINIFGDKQLAIDVIKFLKASNIIQMLPAPTKSFPIYQELYLYYESDENISLPPTTIPDVSLYLKNNTVTLSSEVTNPFCNEWANKLLGVSRENKTDQKPFLECLYFRKIMESWKSKAIEEINAAEKLVRKAEVDHYALFSCFQHFQSNPNKFIILNVLKNDVALTEDNLEVKEVLDVLGELITEDHEMN